MKLTREYAQMLDEKDRLATFREQFYLQDDVIYLDGNSLGLLSKKAEISLLSMLDSWKRFGIDGWTKGENPWFYFAEKLGKLSAPLVGAKREEVIVTGSTTSNLHQLVATFFHPKGKRTKILADALNFPSDIYALQSQLRLHDLDPEEHLVRVKSRDGRTLHEEDLIEAMQDDIALIILPSVLYRSGQVHDMECLTKAAHERGITIGFDLCHSIGAIPHELSQWEVDFAFWCNYKHMNGGPGAVGGLYVNESHFELTPGLTGWFGSNKEKQFDMGHTFTKGAGAGAYQLGTPHILSMAPLLGSLEMFQQAGIGNIRRKSLQLTEYMMELVDHELSDHEFMIANPRKADQRGGHILLDHREAARICKALKANNIIPDFRAPNGIRFAPVALYNTFEEVWQAIQLLKSIMEEKQYEKFSNTREVIA